MARQLLFLELNEVNFEDVSYYCERGLLPNFGRLIDENGWAETISEQRYEELEPWIQWVTAHTGLGFAEHGVFRLGDIVSKDIPQIWELLEDRGLRVGAISPMNAKNRMRNPAFFVPDPWTMTQVAARKRLRALYEAVAQAVNDNAEARLTGGSVVRLLMGLLSYARLEHYSLYARLVGSTWKASWRKAIVLDLLLADVFIREAKRTRPDFATLFVNAAAHIQHHYLFSAASYSGSSRNPTWYIRRGLDPLLDVYQVYDTIVGSIRRAFPDARLMIATALHQVPHGEVTYYWRLRRHAEFLKGIRAPFANVLPRMSRDFLVECESEERARLVEERLASALSTDGVPLFEVDNRGRDVFVMLSYPREIRDRLEFAIGEERFSLAREDVAFVALKNGEHSGIGYFLDSHVRYRRGHSTFALKGIPERIKHALGLYAEENGLPEHVAALQAQSKDVSLTGC